MTLCCTLTVSSLIENMLKLEQTISNIETMWQKLKTFITVAEQGGFTKAAQKLRLSKATITRYIQELETVYQTNFFTRTTRHISLTEAGETFYHYALDMIQLHEEAQSKIKKTAETVQGNIKIGLPFSILERFSREKISLLTETYPDLSLEIIQGNHINDLLSDYFDLVLHCGPLPDVNFYYEKIADWQKMLCASPSYLKKFKTPKHPNELAKHQCLDHADNHTLCWQLVIDGDTQLIPITSKIRINSSTVLKQLAIEGLGIVYLPSFTLSDALADKKLQPILKNNWPESLSIYALYPIRKRYNKKISVILEALRNLLN